ncbi:anti-sigma regulatory factor [Asticcacaulis sp. AC460]|uniref:anti-sigma regulatory factor n=1 Tax=Asticcacaulis sp. AC460 TaxID=1282360 RepID=UPI0004CF9F6E|nr:anti-sigma regulatory factor [Asticcacaulis sp. AC460]
MTVRTPETLMLIVESDIVLVRREVKAWAVDIGFGLVDQTKLVTACSELARNTIIYGGGGSVTLEQIEDFPRRGLRLTFEDRGPGIANLDLALSDGYTTGGGMGLGLSGARRLSNEFDIVTAPGEGTRVTIARWR